MAPPSSAPPSPAPNAHALQLRLNQAIGLHQRGQLGPAEALYREILTLQPGNFVAWQLLGVVAAQAGHPDHALQLIGRAIALKPDYAEAHNNLGMALQVLRRYAEAVDSHDRAIALQPDFVDALNNRGVALGELGQHALAVAAYDKALALQPSYADAWSNRGAALRQLGHNEEAARDFAQAQKLRPGFKYALGHQLFAQAATCDWTDFDAHVEALNTAVRQGGLGTLAAEPLVFAVFSQSAQDQLANARAFAADKYPPAPRPLWTGERYTHDRIRVAYLSADFHDHATTYLMAEFFERHDASRFETIAISFGPDLNDRMRQRLQAAFGRFIDVRAQTDLQVAQLLRSMEVDIAVDLKGFTQGCRTGILAHRPAPVQVNYLGYPGSMGVDYIDHIIGDATVIPPGDEVFYSEQVARLPGSYQVNDAHRAIAEATPTRAAVGLPDSGFVFCCFNNNYKITPAVFDIWMRLLQQVPGSVLWLLEDSPAVARNLRRQAQLRDVAPGRLVFAPRMPQPEHLARHRLADLFLDTLVCNAHTTASDALWAGLPVLTCAGRTFASRVAASLLRAADLPELVTDTTQAYEALALQLATDPAMLAELRARLARNRGTCALFDTALFTRQMERAYEDMLRARVP